MSYTELDADGLNQGIVETKLAIQRARELLKVPTGRTLTKGLCEVAHSIPPLIGKLQYDLEQLEKALQKKGVP